MPTCIANAKMHYAIHATLTADYTPLLDFIWWLRAPAITCSGEHTGASSSSYPHRLKFHNMVITWHVWPEKNCGTLHKQSTGYKAQSSYRAATGLKSRHAPSRSSPEKIASPDKRRSVLDAKPNQEPGMSRERTNQTTLQDTTS